MNNLQTFFEEYIAFCQYQKRLDRKTLNAYRSGHNVHAKYTHRDIHLLSQADPGNPF